MWKSPVQRYPKYFPSPISQHGEGRPRTWQRVWSLGRGSGTDLVWSGNDLGMVCAQAEPEPWAGSL